MIERKPTALAKQKLYEQKRWRTYSLIFVCGLLMVSGFFFAGRQHFASMDFGMKNSRLRKQVDELEAEKRRLLLMREISLSPVEIKKAVRKVGLINSVELAGPVAQVSEATREKAVSPTSTQIKSLVVKTASVSAVPAPITAVYPKPENQVKREKKGMGAE